MKYIVSSAPQLHSVFHIAGLTSLRSFTFGSATPLRGLRRTAVSTFHVPGLFGI